MPMNEYDPSVLDDTEYSGYSYRITYHGIVDSFGFNFVLSEVLGHWQGDIIFIVQDKDGEVGMLVTGYGSCSGCDALEGITSIGDLKSLAAGMHSNIEWFESLSDLQEWLSKEVTQEDPPRGPWYYYSEDFVVWAKGFTNYE